MKKLLFCLSGILFVFSLMIMSCEKDTNSDPDCDDWAMPEITRGFSVDVVVMFADTVAWEGLVTMKFHKEYCNLKISGAYSFTDFCDSDGYFYPDAIPTYKLANSLDKVRIEIHVTYIDNNGNEGSKSFWDILYYDDVRHLITGVDLSYVMILPIRSDEVGN
ncbi:MAG: hypothetical protein RQ761_13155 [Bacteroidales bacterium]|nr:hypothetical protein [Bacteroidales bacterium]